MFRTLFGRDRHEPQTRARRRTFRPDAASDVLERRDLTAAINPATTVVRQGLGSFGIPVISTQRTPRAGFVATNPITSGGTFFTSRVSNGVRNSGINYNVPNAGRGINNAAIAANLPFNPAGATNAFAASSGLAFTNGLGFSNPAQQLSGANSATNGLAFTNGLGFNSPANLFGFANGTVNGLGLVGNTGTNNTLTSAGLYSPLTNTTAFTNGFGSTVVSNGPSVGLPGSTFGVQSQFGLGNNVATAGAGAFSPFGSAAVNTLANTGLLGMSNF